MIIDSRWLCFYLEKWLGFDFSYEICGYFDPRHRVNISLLFFHLTIVLPIWSKYTDECCPPKWGLAYHNQTFWIYRGGKGNWNGGNKWWAFDMPWMLKWVRTSKLIKNGEWEHETKNMLKFCCEKWDNLLWSEVYEYKYILENGDIQHIKATVSVSEREWRPKWLTFFPIFKKIRKTIDVTFDREVGERTGSYKGGVLGCGHDMLKGETPFYCLKRMEKDRIFN